VRRSGFIATDRHFPDARLVYNGTGMEPTGERDAVCEW
jgi:hypothetical protein